MNDSEELKHARDRIQADARTISELREMLEATNKPAPKKPIQRKPERYIASREGAELLVKAIKIKGELLDYRSRLQAMHRRAQRAEGSAMRAKRQAEYWMRSKPWLGLDIQIAPFVKSDALRIEILDFQPPAQPEVTPACKDGGPHYVQSPAPMMVVLPNKQTVAEWADKRLGEPWAQPAPEIFEAHGLEWYRHDDTKPCPCDKYLEVGVFLKSGTFSKMGDKIQANQLIWVGGGIIGWRPADAPEKLPRELVCSKCGKDSDTCRDIRCHGFINGYTKPSRP